MPIDEPGSWTLHGLRVLHDEIVRVEEHDVETPEGRRYRFPLVRSSGFAKVVPLLPDGRVMLVRQYRYAIDAVTLEVPAGAVDPGETPLEAAQRELSEETALRAGSIESLGEFRTSPGRLDERGWLFLARDCRPDPAAVAHEPTEPVVHPLDDAIGMIGTEIVAASSALALLLTRARLSVARVGA